METTFLRMFAGKDLSEIQQKAQLFVSENKVLTAFPFVNKKEVIYFCLEYLN